MNSIRTSTSVLSKFGDRCVSWLSKNVCDLRLLSPETRGLRPESPLCFISSSWALEPDSLSRIWDLRLEVRLLLGRGPAGSCPSSKSDLPLSLGEGSCAEEVLGRIDQNRNPETIVRDMKKNVKVERNVTRRG